MNFYQQKYFKPYRKITSQFKPRPNQTSYQQSHRESDLRYDSPMKQTEYTRGPTFERSPSKYIVHAKTTPQPIWQHLYNEGVKSQKELIQRHNNNKHKIDIECTFQPIIRHNKRYMIHSSSSFLDRVNLWHEQKIEKMVKEKEEQVNKDLKECTFTPRINNKNRTGRAEEDKYALRLDKSQNQLRERNRNINPYYSPIKQAKNKPAVSPIQVRQQAPNIEMSAARKLIKTELKKLAL